MCVCGWVGGGGLTSFDLCSSSETKSVNNGKLVDKQEEGRVDGEGLAPEETPVRATPWCLLRGQTGAMVINSSACFYC